MTSKGGRQDGFGFRRDDGKGRMPVVARMTSTAFAANTERVLSSRRGYGSHP
jgi:hypothetical protein